MRNKLNTAILILLINSIQCIITLPAFAQVTDVSDAFWSIVVPTAAAVDIDMGQVLVGTAKDSVITAYLTNTGQVAIRIDSIFFIGAGAASFALVSGVPPFAIAQGGVKAVEFRFKPQTTGVRNASVVIHTQADTLTRSISGEGVAPQISIPHTLIDFGQKKVNDHRDTTVTYIVRNAGTGTLTISGTAMLGPDATQFSVLRGYNGFALAAGQQDTMTLRFAPKMAGRTSGRLGFYHDSVGSPAIVDLFGEGLGVQGFATLQTDTIRAKAGELVEVPVYLRNALDVNLTGATGFHTELRYNASLLSPFGNTPQGSTANGERTIPLDKLPLQPDAQGILIKLQFIAMLGNTDGTPLHLENSYALGGKVTMTEVPGYFLLTDVCCEGGTRLYHETGKLGLFQNRPNPFNAATIIEYEVIENAPTRLVVMDILGRTVATLVDGVVLPGRYAVSFDASSLASGTYMTVLQTPTEWMFKFMEVLK